MPTTVSTLPQSCANCGHAFGPVRPAFCPACGQESHIKPPTLREFAQQFGGAYFSTEGAMWRTLKLLLFKPGELTVQYLRGRRKHYVLPLRLYLTISVLVLLLVRALGSSGVVEIKVNLDNPKDRQELRNFTIIGLGEEGHGVGVRDGVFYCNSIPEWVCKRVQKRISTDAKGLVSDFEDFRDRFVANLGGAMFLLLPTFALWLKLAYRSRRMRYTEHLVFALHIHAFWFLALAPILADRPWLTGIGCTAVPLYTMLALRRVYGGRRWPRFLRAAFISLLYLVMMSLALTVVALWTLVV